MAIGGSEVDSVGTTTAMEGCKTVFVDTSLNTQLAMPASYTDTVSDFKNKLVLQHMHWFPEFGEIKIHSLKVKLRGKFYHLSDILLVRNVFDGVKGHWYLTADTSRTSTCHLNQISSGPELSEGLKTNVTEKICDVNYGVSPSDVNRGPTAMASSGEIATEKNVANFQLNSSSVEDSEFHSEKKRKISRKENVCHNSVLKDIVSKDADCENVMIDAVEAVESARTDQLDANNGVAFDETTDNRKKDTMLERVVLDSSTAGIKSENEFGNDIRTDNLEGVSVKEPNLSAGSVDNNGTLHYVKSESKKRKKSKKTAVKIQNLSDLEVETRKGESIQEPYMAGAAEKIDFLESDKRKEDIVLENTVPASFMGGKSENELGRNDQANHLQSPSTKELNLSAMSNSDATQDANIDGRKKRKKNNKGETVEKTLVPATEEKVVGNFQNLLASDEMRDNTVLDSGIPTEKSEVITVKDSNVSARAVDTSGTMQEAKSEGKKRNKSKKKGAEIQDMSQMEHEIRKGESNEPCVETVKTIEKEDEGNLSLNLDEKEMLSSQSKTSDCIGQNLTRNETSSLPDLPNIVVENKISDGTGKKKREKKSDGINLEKPALEQTNDGVKVSSLLLSFDISEVVQIKESNASVANMKLPIANENEANIVISRIVQSLEDDGKSESKERKKSKKTAAKIQNLSDLEVETRKAESIQEPYMAGAAEKIDFLESDKRKEDIVLENTVPESFMAGKSEKELGRNEQANHLESPSTKELNLSAISNGDAMQDANTDGRKKRKKNKKGETVEKTLVPATEEKIVGNSQNLLASDEMRDNTVSDSGIPTEKSEVMTVKDSNVSARAVDTSGTMQEAKSEGKKRKKSKKKGAEIQDMSQMEHENRKGESNEPCVETVKTIEKEDEGNSSLNHDEKEMLSSQTKTSDCISQDLTRNETSSLPDLSEANIVVENKISDGTGKKKKKREKKSAGINLEKPALEQTNDGVNGSSGLLSFDLSEEVQIKESNASVANKKLPIANENEANIVISPIVQSLEDDGTKENKMGNDGQSCNTPDANFPVLAKENEIGTKENKMGNNNQSCNTPNANFPVLAKENEIVESNLAEKNNEDGKKSKKKRNKNQVRASDVQDNFPVKDQNISAEILVTEENFPTKGANITSYEANRKLPSANENKADIVMSQSEQTLEDDGAKKKKMGNDADFPVLAKENEILESNLAEIKYKDTGDEGKKSKKKRKKSHVSASDVQENFPIKDKKMSVVTHVNEENFPIKGANIASSDKSEENLKIVHGPTVVTDAQEINFRQHFVRDQNQSKIASGDNIKGASQSNGEMETGKNVKNDGLSSISPSTNLQNSFKSSDKQDSENKSSHKSARGMRNRDSTLNSQNLVKDSKQMSPASSYSGKKNTSLFKSSSERSEAFLSNRQDKKRDPVLNVNTKTVMKTPQAKNLFLKPGVFSQDNSKNSVTNKMMLMKTPQKQSLLTKLGSIFQDNSVEVSLDDNGNIDSDASTHNSSDSSSQSGDSDGESEMSHNTNGAYDGKGISNSGMLDGRISMRKILRSSEQFKKAKLIASQSEVEQDELFLDSQPNP